MPLTKKGEKIERHMEAEYGGKKAGERVFYASKNAGKITGVDRQQVMRRGGGFDGTDMLNRAIAAGREETEAQSQARRLLRGASVSGRDRGSLRRR